MPDLRRPDADSRWRCAQCGNLTRFDVVRRSRTREYWHLDLSGEPQVESSETLVDELESVTCRWCGSGAAIEVVARPDR
ncbi:MAG: hypothetical protein MUD13_08140 [Candidatus Nanopelagicales bacterium]|jgi:hypothetical protein|nr:hypothetical protein [Candidatus Nanopelagicales bacterium]